ncbi:MAG: DUF3800 domain-containing protein [Oscillospiraceae bacterium]|nr:DUF3800 domain-containing protein [Oscillospiraceae bacterium]
MKRNYLFIDDSGDIGFKNESSSHFLIAAVLVVDEEEKQTINDTIDAFRHSLGWTELHEFKFNNVEKKIVLNFINEVKKHDFSSYVMVLDKSKINRDFIPKNKASLYFRIIIELLLKLKLSNPVITIDGRADKLYAKEIKTFLRKGLKEKGVHGSRVFLVDSRKNSLIQLTDIIAGSVARSYNKSKTDNQAYVKALGNKITDIFEMKL